MNNKTYISGSEAAKGHSSAFQELLSVAEKFLSTPEKNPKRFSKNSFELSTLLTIKDCQNN